MSIYFFDLSKTAVVKLSPAAERVKKIYTLFVGYSVCLK